MGVDAFVEKIGGPTYKEGWCGFFNIPREVRMRKDGTLQFLPIREVETIRENPKMNSRTGGLGGIHRAGSRRWCVL